MTQSIIRYRPIEKLKIIGDFNGDGKIDTLYQNNFSNLTYSSIDSIPDPFENEWDTVVHFLYRLESDVILTISKNLADTLHLGTALGLYCLINIGDNNNDKKDEIALVIDHCDYTRLNSCLIYTLCNKKWFELMNFRIHEEAFEFPKGDSNPIFKEIKGFLEYKNKKWMYIDYDRMFNAEKTKDIIMKPLKIMNGC